MGYFEVLHLALKAMNVSLELANLAHIVSLFLRQSTTHACSIKDMLDTDIQILWAQAKYLTNSQQ